MDEMLDQNKGASGPVNTPEVADASNLGVQKATPEEQQQYNMIVGSAMNVVYDKSMINTVVTLLEGNGDPVEGLAQTTALVLVRIAQSAKKAGQEFDGGVMLHAGTNVFEDLAELSREAGIKDFSQSPDDFEAAYFRALDAFRVYYNDSVGLDPEAAKQDLAKLQQMDETGALEKLLTDMAKNDFPEAPAPKKQSGLGVAKEKETV